MYTKIFSNYGGVEKYLTTRSSCCYQIRKVLHYFLIVCDIYTTNIYDTSKMIKKITFLALATSEIFRHFIRK